MAYVPVPKDLNAVKTKVLLNLTKRQLICFGAEAALGVALVFLIIQVEQLVRMVIGLKLYFKGAWLIDLTQEVKTA